MALLSKDGIKDGRCRRSAQDNVPFPDPELNVTLQRCLKRVCCWRPPPNWSAADWLYEIKAHAVSAICQAQRDYDPSRGVPLYGFVYQRVVARAFTRYRQEWTYACRNAPSMKGNGFEDTFVFEDESAGSECTPYCHEELCCAMASLSEIQRSIIEQTFWHERTETELAKTMGISQPAVNKRKHLALIKLREVLREAEQSWGRRL